MIALLTVLEVLWEERRSSGRCSPPSVSSPNTPSVWRLLPSQPCHYSFLHEWTLTTRLYSQILWSEVQDGITATLKNYSRWVIKWSTDKCAASILRSGNKSRHCPSL